MPEFTRLLLTQFNSETLTIMCFALILVTAAFVAYWMYNRKRFHELRHHIPASIVKSYLDSIIQNSSSLKSSLFRGGGLEIGEGIPSVMPVADLSASGAGGAELSQKNAEIAALRAQLGDKDKTISDLERRLSEVPTGDGGVDPGPLNDEIAQLKQTIEDLQRQLEEAKANAGGGGGGDDALKQQLDLITKERDELKERLQEYEIIEDDLANLKKLQQENEQLKKSLAELKGGAAPEEAPAAATEEAAAAPAEAVAEEAAVEEVAAEEAAAPAAEEAPAEEASSDPASEAPPVNEEGEGKSAEDLLSEFEKMLG